VLLGRLTRTTDTAPVPARQTEPLIQPPSGFYASGRPRSNSRNYCLEFNYINPGRQVAIKVMWTGRGSPRVTRVLLLWPTVTVGHLRSTPTAISAWA
jgi:hypothetical protein